MVTLLTKRLMQSFPSHGQHEGVTAHPWIPAGPAPGPAGDDGGDGTT